MNLMDQNSDSSRLGEVRHVGLLINKEGERESVGRAAAMYHLSTVHVEHVAVPVEGVEELHEVSAGRR